MSTLTKVFAVLLVVLCIGFSMSVVQHLVTSTNERALKETAIAEKLAAQAAAEAAYSEMNSANKQCVEEQKAHTATKVLLQDQATKHAKDVADLQKLVADEKAKNTQLAASLDTALAVSKGAQAQVAALTEQTKALRDDNSKLVAERTGLNNLVREREREIESQRFTNERLNKAVSDLQDQNRDLLRKLQSAQFTPVVGQPAAGGGVGEEIQPVIDRPLKGQIKKVRADLAEISVGEDDGVRVGMKFLVYRGDQLLATFIADRVEPDEAAGRLVNIKGEVKGGDNVLANPRLF